MRPIQKLARGCHNPREALSDTPDCCSSIAFFPTATADHVFGCQTAHPDYNRRMASATDGSPRPAPALDVRLLVDNMPMLAWSSHADGSVDFVNQQWREYTGLSTEESHGPGLKAAVHPDDLPGLLQQWETQPELDNAVEHEVRLRRSDGAFRWFSIRREPLHDQAGALLRWYGTATDIEDRKRAEDLAAGEKRLLEMVTSGHSMQGILEALCQFVESTTSGCYCSVVLVDPGGTHLEHGAAPSLPESFVMSIVGRPLNADSGPCAMAAYLNEQVIAADLTTETRWAAYEWCPMALAHGVRACWSTPISSTAGKVLGAFAIYYDEPRTPTPLHQSLIEQFTHIASIAVERAQSDAALKRSETFLAEAQRLSSTGSFSWRVATDEITWSEQLYRIYE